MTSSAALEEVPEGVEDITAAWVEAVLAPRLPDVAVASIDVAPVRDGAGLVGQVAHVVPHYDVAPDGAPTALIVKLPTRDAQIRGFANGMGMYEREGRFYADIAPRVELRVPRVLHNACDPAADRYCLVMEAVDVGQRINQLGGVPPKRAAEVIATIGAFHAAWHDHPMLNEWTWLPRPSDPLNKVLAPRFEGAWPHFERDYAHRVPGDTAHWVQEFAPQMNAWWDSKDAPPYTIVHGDFRLDNMLWTPAGELVLLDWQIVQCGFGLYDVAYFIVTNLKVDDRRTHEDALLALWRDTMLAGGADPGSPDEVHRLYRETVLFWATGVACATAEFGSTPEGRTLVDTLVERAFTAAADLNVGEVLT